MGWWADRWEDIKQIPNGVLGAPDQAQDLGQGAVDGAEKLGDKLDDPMRESGQGDVNQANFQLPGYGSRQQQFNTGFNRAINGKAPQAGQSGFRQDQRMVMDRLRRQMNGEDSLAQAQLRQNTDTNIAAQRSLAAGANPRNAALSARMAGQNIGNINQAANGQAGMLGIAERLGATNAYGGMANTARGQDDAMSLANANLRQQQTGLNQQGALGFGSLANQNAGLQQAGNMGYEQNKTARYGADLGVPSTGEGLLSMGGAILGGLAMSDERTKTNVQDGGHEADSFLDSLQPNKFEYKPGASGMATGRTKLTPPEGSRPPTPRAHGKDGHEYPPNWTQADVDKIEAQRAATRKWSQDRMQAGPPASLAPDSPQPKDTPVKDGMFVDKDGRPMRSIRDQYNVDEQGNWTPKPLGPPAPTEGPPIPKGEVLGVMAQDVEKTPMGANGVGQMASDGAKMLDPTRLTGAFLAGLGRLNERLKQVEGKK